jgi:16S rRNA (uracil1498-N3)-methyltransferase
LQRHRFFAPSSSISGSSILLDREETHHLARVLRLSEGATAFAFDDTGAEYECRVTEVMRNAATLTIVEELADQIESPLELTLAQSFIKGDKFDWVVQKSTELGVVRIVPLLAEHSTIAHKRELSGDRLTARWQRIALEAVKQSGRRRLIEITQPLSLAGFLANDSSALRLILSETTGRRLNELAGSRPASVSIAVGPEGGWSPAELSQAQIDGVVPLHLGPRILRSETAAVAGVALAQHIFGDFE